RLLDVDAAEPDDRPNAVEALVVVAVDPQVVPLAADVTHLEYRAERFVLDIEVVRHHDGIPEIRIDGVDRAPRTRRRGEWVGQADIAGVVHRGREGWIGSQRRHDVGHRLGVVETGAGADHGLALAERIEREADPRPEVRVLFRVGLARARRAGDDHFILGEIVEAQAVVDLARYAVELPAQAQVHRQALADFEIVLQERVECADAQAGGRRQRGFRGRGRSTRQESGHAAEVDHATRAAIEVVVVETPELHPAANRLPAVDPTQGVVILVGGIAAALRKAADTAEGQRTWNEDFGKHGGRGRDPEVGRVRRVGSDEVDADAV